MSADNSAAIQQAMLAAQKSSGGGGGGDHGPIASMLDSMWGNFNWSPQNIGGLSQFLNWLTGFGQTPDPVIFNMLFKFTNDRGLFSAIINAFKKYMSLKFESSNLIGEGMSDHSGPVSPSSHATAWDTSHATSVHDL
jgi:hypothetical protein